MKLITFSFLLILSVNSFAGNIGFLETSIRSGELEVVNTYLEENSKSVSKQSAKEALHILNLEYVKYPNLVNIELNQRLRNIAF